MQHFVSSYGNVQLKESLFSQHRDRDVRYLMELRTEDLLFSHYAEAGLNGWLNYTPKTHGGWDSPTSQIRGTFTGHWLSAAARIYQETGDIQLKKPRLTLSFQKSADAKNKTEMSGPFLSRKNIYTPCGMEKAFGHLSMYAIKI